MTTNQIKDCLEYRNGGLYWTRQVQKNRDQTGERVGYERSDGYRVFKIFGNRFYEHQIIFWLFHGRMPKEIDHIDRNTRNNSIENLREVTRSLNNYNRNCEPELINGKYRVKIARKHYGMFDSYQEAKEKISQVKESILYA